MRKTRRCIKVRMWHKAPHITYIPVTHIILTPANQSLYGKVREHTGLKLVTFWLLVQCSWWLVTLSWHPAKQFRYGGINMAHTINAGTRTSDSLGVMAVLFYWLTLLLLKTLSLSNSLSLSLSLSLFHFHCQAFHEGWSHYPAFQSWYREVIELTAGAWSCDLSATVLMLYWLTYPGFCNSLQQSIPCQCT